MTESASVRIRDICTLVTKGTTPTSIGRNFTQSGVRFLKVETFRPDGTLIPDRQAFIDVATHAALRRSQLQTGDLLFSIAGALGRTTVVKEDWLPANINQALALIRLSQRGQLLNPRFVSWQLRGPAITKLVSDISVQAAQANLSLEQVRNFQIPIISLHEQSAVVAALDDANALIGSLEQLIAKKSDIKQGLYQALLSGHTRLPGFHEPWAQIRLGDHVTFLRTAALSRAQLDSESPIRCLHYGDIHTRRSVRLHAATESMTRAAGPLVARAGRLTVGDLVFADASEDESGVGKSLEIQSVPTEGLVAGLHTIAARFDKQVLADGFKAYLQFIPNFRPSLLRLAAGTKVLATTRTYLASIELALPAVAEQTAIAQVLIDADSGIAALEAQLEKVRLIKQGMMQELLTGRTRLVKEGAI